MEKFEYRCNKFDNSVYQNIPGLKIPSRVRPTTIMAERQAKIIAADLNDIFDSECDGKYRCMITEYGIRII